MRALADNIRDRRKALGWTQEELAERAGLNRVTVARLETSSTKSEWPTICAVADALGCTTDELRKIPEKVTA